jgi:hypothetical protein
VVRLSAEERSRLDEFVRKGKRAGHLLTKARILFSNGSRAGASSECRRFRVPVFSARSPALDGVSWVQGG